MDVRYNLQKKELDIKNLSKDGCLWNVSVSTSTCSQTSNNHYTQIPYTHMHTHTCMHICTHTHTHMKTRPLGSKEKKLLISPYNSIQLEDSCRLKSFFDKKLQHTHTHMKTRPLGSTKTHLKKFRMNPYRLKSYMAQALDIIFNKMWSYDPHIQNVVNKD